MAGHMVASELMYSAVQMNLVAALNQSELILIYTWPLFYLLLFYTMHYLSHISGKSTNILALAKMSKNQTLLGNFFKKGERPTN